MKGEVAQAALSFLCSLSQIVGAGQSKTEAGEAREGREVCLTWVM